MAARLGVNIDHIATLRQLRGTPYPDLGVAAQMAVVAGAEQITVHLREDRRHIQDEDVKRLRKELTVPLNRGSSHDSICGKGKTRMGLFGARKAPRGDYRGGARCGRSAEESRLGHPNPEKSKNQGELFY